MKLNNAGYNIKVHIEKEGSLEKLICENLNFIYGGASQMNVPI